MRSPKPESALYVNDAQCSRFTPTGGASDCVHGVVITYRPRISLMSCVQWKITDICCWVVVSIVKHSEMPCQQGFRGVTKFVQNTFLSYPFGLDTISRRDWGYGLCSLEERGSAPVQKIDFLYNVARLPFDPLRLRLKVPVSSSPAQTPQGGLHDASTGTP